MPTAKIRTTRPMLFDGIAQPAGVTLALPAEQALDVVESGRAAFVDPEDRGRCMDARRKSIHGMLRRVPLVADPGSPWRPVHDY